MTARALARPLTFPVLFGGAVAASYALSTRWGWALMPVAGALSVLVFLTVMALERWLPHRPEWNRRDGQLWNDLGHTVFGTGLGAALGNAGVELLGATLGLWALSRWGTQLWPHQWPVAAQVVAIVLLADLGRYAQHRLLHGVPWLWRFHSLHHSGEVLTALKTSRSHLLERVFQQLFMYGPLALLGAPAPLVLCYAVPNTFLGTFSHCNADLELGYLEYLVMGPKSHRLHHSADPIEGNRNFGSALVFWDQVFGTWINPRRRPSPAVMGIEGDVTPKGFVAQVLEPFAPRVQSRTVER